MRSKINSLVQNEQSDNQMIYSLMWFLRFSDPDNDSIDSNTPIEAIDRDILILAIMFLECHHGINVPDQFVEDRSKTLNQLANEIRQLPKLSDDAFKEQMLQYKFSVRAAMERN